MAVPDYHLTGPARESAGDGSVEAGVPRQLLQVGRLGLARTRAPHDENLRPPLQLLEQVELDRAVRLDRRRNDPRPGKRERVVDEHRPSLAGCDVERFELRVGVVIDGLLVG